MQFYYYDSSEWFPLLLAENGLFKIRSQSRFWTTPAHHPFHVKVDDQLAGFALVDNDVVDGESQFNIAQFFFARRYRGQGIGRRAATLLFDQFRGRWEVYQLTNNLSAQAFWRQTIASYTHGIFHEVRTVIDSLESVQQRFDSSRAPRFPRPS